MITMREVPEWWWYDQAKAINEQIEWFIVQMCILAVVAIVAVLCLMEPVE